MGIIFKPGDRVITFWTKQKGTILNKSREFKGYWDVHMDKENSLLICPENSIRKI